MNSAALNMSVHISVQVTSFEYLYRSGIAGPYGKSAFCGLDIVESGRPVIF